MILIGNRVEQDPQNPQKYLFNDYTLDSDSPIPYFRKNTLNSEPLINEISKRNPDIVKGFLGLRNQLVGMIKAGFRIRKLVKKEKVELVHVLWGTSSSLLTVLFSPVPVVVSFCGSDLIGNYKPDGSKTFKGRLSSWMSVISSFFAKKIILKSPNLRNYLPSSVLKKAVVIPNGVDTNLFKPMSQAEARAYLGWKPDEKVVLFFTSWGAHVKNRPLADKVFELIQQRIPNARLQLVQELPFTELPYYYNAADLLLLTSFHEGSNNSVKESMACNLPVVSVNCGDAAERLKDTSPSFVSHTYDAEVLAEAAVQILNAGTRSNGRDHIMPLSIEKTADQVLNVYKEASGKQ